MQRIRRLLGRRATLGVVVGGLLAGVLVFTQPAAIDVLGQTGGPAAEQTDPVTVLPGGELVLPNGVVVENHAGISVAVSQQGNQITVHAGGTPFSVRAVPADRASCTTVQAGTVVCTVSGNVRLIIESADEAVSARFPYSAAAPVSAAPAAPAAQDTTASRPLLLALAALVLGIGGGTALVWRRRTGR